MKQPLTQADAARKIVRFAEHVFATQGVVLGRGDLFAACAEAAGCKPEEFDPRHLTKAQDELAIEQQQRRAAGEKAYFVGYVARDEDGEIVEAAPTKRELLTALKALGVKRTSVTIEREEWLV